jgi:hypothetical protein
MPATRRATERKAFMKTRLSAKKKPSSKMVVQRRPEGQGQQVAMSAGPSR